MPVNPSLRWQRIKDIFYSLRTCYDSLSWPIANLSPYHKVAISPTSSLAAVASIEDVFPKAIDVYSTSGQKLWDVVFHNNADSFIVDFAFHNENLLIILSNQKFRYYNDFEGNFEEHSFTSNLIKVGDDSGPQITEHYITNLENGEKEEIFKIITANVWGKFLVIQFSRNIIITDLESFDNYLLPIEDFNLYEVHSLKLLKAENDSFTLLASYRSTIISITVNLSSLIFDVLDHYLTDGPFEMVTASPNGQLVALYNSHASTIFVTNSKFNQVLLEYDTSNDIVSPFQIEWCANDAIVLALRDEITLIGPGQQSVSFYYDVADEEEETNIDSIMNRENHATNTIPILKADNIGLHVFTSKKVEFLCRVSDSTKNLYQVGTSNPGSILLDCIDKFGEQSFKAYTNISLLKMDGTLREAMDSCLDVSLEEFSSSRQKRLLRAVSFGMAHGDVAYDADHYLKILNTLKVLNQLRSPEVGIFLTNIELKVLGWEKVISMLLRRNMHFLALKIIELMGLTVLSNSVYTNWCCKKVEKEKNSSDIELFITISKKLANLNIGIRDIYNVSYREGRNDLCKLLVSFEPSIVERISLTLGNDPEAALLTAFQTANFDFSQLILLQLQVKFNEPQFLKILNQNQQRDVLPESASYKLSDVSLRAENIYISGDLISHFWMQSLGEEFPRLLESFLNQEDRKSDLDVIQLRQFSMKNSTVEIYKLLLQKATNSEFNRTTKALLGKEASLIELQSKLSETYHIDFSQTHSINQVLSKLIEIYQLKPVFKIAKEYKVSTEKIWYLILRIYSKSKQFDKFYDFVTKTSNDKSNLKSPIGFKPIVSASFIYGFPKEHVTIYIMNYTAITYLERAQLFIKNGDYINAAKEAVKHKDVDLLQQLKEKVSGLQEMQGLAVVNEFLKNLGY